MVPDPGPARVLAAGYLVDGTGTGLWMATSVLYFTRSLGLPAGRVGAGLSVAGLVGLLGAVPLGHLADRRGLRGVGIALMLAQAGLMAAFALLRSFAPFLAVACLYLLAQRGTNAVRNALLGVSVPADRRLRVRAYTRSTANVGFALGALLAVPVLHADSRSAYVAALLGNAASFLVAGALLGRLPRVPPLRPGRAGEARWVALRDRRYVTMTVLVGLLGLHKPVLTVALPLWVRHTGAPPTLVAALLLVNTALTVALQVPLSRGADGYSGGLRTVRRAGVTLAVACVVLAAASGRTPAVAVVLLVAGTTVLTAGELWQSAGGWGLSYDLAPADRYGQYQGVYALGNGVRDTVGPYVVTALAVGAGGPGWLVLAAGFAAVGLLAAPVLDAFRPAPAAGPGGGASAQPSAGPSPP